MYFDEEEVWSGNCRTEVAAGALILCLGFTCQWNLLVLWNIFLPRLQKYYRQPFHDSIFVSITF